VADELARRAKEDDRAASRYLEKLLEKDFNL